VGRCPTPSKGFTLDPFKNAHACVLKKAVKRDALVEGSGGDALTVFNLFKENLFQLEFQKQKKNARTCVLKEAVKRAALVGSLRAEVLKDFLLPLMSYF